MFCDIYLFGVANNHFYNCCSLERQLPSDWHQKLSDKEKESIHQEVLTNVKSNNSGSLSNGCLMRISPLAVFSLREPDQRYFFEVKLS